MSASVPGELSVSVLMSALQSEEPEREFVYVLCLSGESQIEHFMWALPPHRVAGMHYVNVTPWER